MVSDNRRSILKLFLLALLPVVFAAQSAAAQQSKGEQRARSVPIYDNLDLASESSALEKRSEMAKKTDLKARAGKKGESSPVASSNPRREAQKSSAQTDQTDAQVDRSEQPVKQEKRIERSFTTGDPRLDQIIRSAGEKNGIDSRLIFSVMKQESGFNPRAVSYKGACGLMQLMPATARRFGVQNIFDIEENIHGGARYLRFLLDLFDGNVKLALAGYNAGEGAVIKYGYRIPPYAETQTYVSRIIEDYGSENEALLANKRSGDGEGLMPRIAVYVNEKGGVVFTTGY